MQTAITVAPPMREGLRPMISTVKNETMVAILVITLRIREAKKGQVIPARPKK